MADNKDLVAKLQATLIDAAAKCSERCLYQSAKWAAELGSSLAVEPENDEDQTMDNSTADFFTPAPEPTQARLEKQEAHLYLLAKSYFDCREFERCTAVFLPSGLPEGPMVTETFNRESPASKVKSRTSGPSSTPLNGVMVKSRKLSEKSLFIALYAQYLSGERKKEETQETILGPADRNSTDNSGLAGISKILEDYFTSVPMERPTTGWLEYLYGVILAKGKNDADAKRWLIRSVNLCPFNWGAWLELSDLVNSVEELVDLKPELPENVMSMIFILYANQMLYQNSDHVWRLLSDLERLFPKSQFLNTQRALLLYHAKDFEEAEVTFSNILHKDPHRLDNLDHYSNILYVMRNRPKLAFLAQLALATDKFRPETCCVVGNYFSLKSEHEKAVQYFRRALMLDRNFLAAWTLMGHEYVEMKNTHAAIESYRRAVDVNRKDYRAWYGLGQTYEVLEMHLYALFYYQRASSLRPLDPTMWTAVGNCYDKIGRPLQSIKAYKRALVAGTYYDTSSSFSSAITTGGAPDPYMVSDTMYNIALMYERLRNMTEAAAYMEMTLAQEDGNEPHDMDEEASGNAIGVTMTTSKARMWLARYEFSRANLKRANELANELCQDGVEVEEAKALIRGIRAQMESA